MAEEEDDDTFGEFASASLQSNSKVSAQNSWKDEEWGDFVKSPQKSGPSDASSLANHPSGSSQSQNLWVKPRGALPLSIFGENEWDEEVDNPAAQQFFNQEKSRVIAGNLNSTVLDKDVSKPPNLSIADLYDHSSRIKLEEWLGSDSTGGAYAVENDVESSSNQHAARSTANALRTEDLSNLSYQSQLRENNDIEEVPSKSYVPETGESFNLFGSWVPEVTGFSSNFKGGDLNGHTLGSNFHMNDQTLPLDGPLSDIDDNFKGGNLNGHTPGSNFHMNDQTLPLDGPLSDIDDDSWEFKDAYSQSTHIKMNGLVGILVSQVPEENTYSGIATGPIRSVDFFGSSNGLIDFMGRSTESAEYFATPDGISSASQEVDLVSTEQITASPVGLAANLNSITEPSDREGVLNRSIDVQSSEDEEEFGEFASAFAEYGSKKGEEFANGLRSFSIDAISNLESQMLKDRRVNYQKDAIPLSVFGYEPTESGGSSDVEDKFIRHQSFSHQRNLHTPTTAISIDDLKSSLRTPAEPFADTALIPAPNQQNLPNVLVNNGPLIDKNYLIDSSWDSKVAFQTIIESDASVSGLSSDLKLNSYLDFYSKLKEELCSVAKCNIGRLKHAQHNSAINDEDGRATSIDSEFKLLSEELKQMNFLWEESNSRNHSSQDNPISQLVEVLQEPQFQILESEYQLSQKLLLVEQDLGSAMELIRHTATMMKILSIGTIDDQRAYVSVWFEMISVCAAELKHGASIWNQAVEKHVQKELLTEIKGRKFFLALGEIYRAAVVIGASARLFKPWILADSLISPAFYAHLEECHAVWSSSGLEDAISSISDLNLASDTSLFKSIKHIFSLDLITLEKHVFAQNTSRCGLSMLTSEVVPGMKMVTWGNEQCIVTLGNLYSNLISRNPPRLPQFYIG